MGLPWFYRLYFYGIHGFFDEVVFTCLYDCYFAGFNSKLTGCSSIYVFLLYGVSSLIVDRIYIRYLKNRYNFIMRGIFYICFAFSWEFTSGLILRQFSACPWDYSENRYNIYGLITLEYSPVWCFCGFLIEFIANIIVYTY